MDNNKLYNDFEEMKEQMSLLKNKLAKQSLINEKLIRQSMSNNQSYINRQGRSSIITAFVTIPLGIAVFALYGFSIYFCIITAAILAFAVYKMWQLHKTLWDLDFTNCDLITISEQTQKLKKNYTNWPKYSIPVFLVWLLLIYMEYNHMPWSDTVHSLGIGAFVGGALGTICGYIADRKVIRKANEILEYIEEIRSGE